MYIVFFFRNVIEYFYIKYNQTSTIFKRDFNDLSYFEKLFLSFFYRKNIFDKSIANIFKNNSLLSFRQKNYPLIFFFHLYFDKMEYKFTNLKLIKKQFYFFSKSVVFSKTLNNFKKLFFKNNKNISIILVFLIIQKIFFKRYFNLCSSIYFNKLNSLNLVKLNWIFYLFLENSKGYFKIYDLSKYSDWYDFNFKHINKFKKNIKNKKSNKVQTLKVNFNLNKNDYFYKIYNHYNKFFKKIFLSLSLTYKNLILVNLSFLNNFNIKLSNNWLNSLKTFYPIRFSETSVSKHIKLDNINNYIFFYIRKNRIFNKGRYSRNRQLYRTGVYWCLWLNIMLVYGLYFMFYRFTFNFGYFWWGLLIFAYSTIFSRVLKYNFFNIFYLKNEFFYFLKWLGFIFLNVKDYILYILKNYIYINMLYLLHFFENTFISNLFYINVIKIKIFFFKTVKFKDSDKFIYFWESMPYKDESFLRHKSVIHWFTQLYKLLTY